VTHSFCNNSGKAYGGFFVKQQAVKVLLIEDEIKLAEVVSVYLSRSGYEVSMAHTGKQGLELFQEIQPSLVLLDLMLPDISGEDVCKTLRKTSSVPIIMLTAKSQEEDILNGLDIGADDYVTKPFSPKQLVARIAALLRRSGERMSQSAGIMSYCNDDLVIDPNSHELWKSGEKIVLTANEYRILMALARYPKKVFTRAELIEVALGSDYEGYDRGIDSHIKNIRQKIETDTKSPRYVLTVHGVGYRFGGEDQ
jgi:DNA-binding response OmpR family regulator